MKMTLPRFQSNLHLSVSGLVNYCCLVGLLPDLDVMELFVLQVQSRRHAILLILEIPTSLLYVMVDVKSFKNYFVISEFESNLWNNLDEK